jgi:hypothetical protein
MPERATIIVLCEDSFHRMFITAFVKEHPVLRKQRFPRIEALGSRSSVLAAVPPEIRRLRQGGLNSRLWIIVDADAQSASEIREELDGRLHARGLAPISGRDPVLVIAPKWELENWALFLLDGNASESRLRAASNLVGDRGRVAARKLADFCHGQSPLLESPPSLTKCCSDWNAHYYRHSFEAT